jgi:hypothetical protein
LNHDFYWNGNDLQGKLDELKDYFNESRVHSGIEGKTPNCSAEVSVSNIANLENFKWNSQCNGLFQMPIAGPFSKSLQQGRCSVFQIGIQAHRLFKRGLRGCRILVGSGESIFGAFSSVFGRSYPAVISSPKANAIGFRPPVSIPSSVVSSTG